MFNSPVDLDKSTLSLARLDIGSFNVPADARVRECEPKGAELSLGVVTEFVREEGGLAREGLRDSREALRRVASLGWGGWGGVRT